MAYDFNRSTPGGGGGGAGAQFQRPSMSNEWAVNSPPQQQQFAMQNRQSSVSPTQLQDPRQYRASSVSTRYNTEEGQLQQSSQYDYVASDNTSSTQLPFQYRTGSVSPRYHMQDGDVQQDMQYGDVGSNDISLAAERIRALERQQTTAALPVEINNASVPAGFDQSRGRTMVAPSQQPQINVIKRQSMPSISPPASTNRQSAATKNPVSRQSAAQYISPPRIALQNRPSVSANTYSDNNIEDPTNRPSVSSVDVSPRQQPSTAVPSQRQRGSMAPQQQQQAERMEISPPAVRPDIGSRSINLAGPPMPFSRSMSVSPTQTTLDGSVSMSPRQMRQADISHTMSMSSMSQMPGQYTQRPTASSPTSTSADPASRPSLSSTPHSPRQSAALQPATAPQNWPSAFINTNDNTIGSPTSRKSISSVNLSPRQRQSTAVVSPRHRASMAPPQQQQQQQEERVRSPDIGSRSMKAVSAHNYMARSPTMSTSPTQMRPAAPASASNVEASSVSMSPRQAPGDMARSMSISHTQSQMHGQHIQPLGSSSSTSTSAHPATARPFLDSPTPLSPRQSASHQATTQSSKRAARDGSASPPQLNRYFSIAAPRVSVLTPTNKGAARPSTVASTRTVHFGSGRPSTAVTTTGITRTRTITNPAYDPTTTTSTTSNSYTNTNGNDRKDYHLAVTEVVLRSLAVLASAVAFFVMITNSVWTNGTTVSYSRIAGFRYVAGISASALIVSVIQIGAMIAQKLKSHTMGLEIKPKKIWLFATLIFDQMLAYLLLSAGSVGVGVLVYVTYVCNSFTLPAEYCSRSTLSVVLTLVSCMVIAMNSVLSTFRFYQTKFGST